MHRVKWNVLELEKAGINEIDKEFMSKQGMPNLESDELEFSTKYLIETLDGTDCHKIGTYGIFNDISLYVRKSIPGVWTLDEESEELILINSSTKSFSKFIGLREKYLLDMTLYLPAKILEEFVIVMYKAMEEIDPLAMAADGVWQPFMEDLRNHVTEY